MLTDQPGVKLYFKFDERRPVSESVREFVASASGEWSGPVNWVLVNEKGEEVMAGTVLP